MKCELISIIVLVYNTEKYVKKCLDSILKQTYQNIEVIVINDGSNDKSSKIINRIANKDDRIKLFERVENKGTYYSRLEGYKKAKGKYVMYVDSDDYIEKNTVETMYMVASEYKTDIVHCQHKILKNGKIIVPKNILNRNVEMDMDHFEPQLFDLLYKTEHCSSICKQLIRKPAMKPIKNINKKDLIYGEDLACNIEIYKEMKSIVFIPDELYIYNLNEEGITKTKDTELIKQKIEDICYVYKVLFNSVKDFKIKDKKYYKKMACVKMYYYLSKMLAKYIKYSSNSKRDIINYINDILNSKELKEIRKFINDNSIDDELKEYKKKRYKRCKLLIDNKINKFYYYSKLFLSPMKDLQNKIEEYNS